MPFQNDGLFRRFLSRSTALSLGFLLAACGGDGTNVASIPPPPPPPPTVTAASIEVQTSWLTSPATRVGSYDVVGRVSLTPGDGGPSTSRLASPGEFTMVTSRPSDQGFSYLLNAPAGLFPGGSPGPVSFVSSWEFNLDGQDHYYFNPYGDYIQYFGQNLTAYTVYSDGTKAVREDNDFSRMDSTFTKPLDATTNLESRESYDIGFSYVAMGEWSSRIVDLNGDPPGDSASLLFVNGERTPGTGIPTTGTATYSAHSLNLLASNLSAGIPFTLTADFGQRTISSQISQNYTYDPDPNDADSAPILGIHVSGSAPFENSGSFDIPLSGTINYAEANVPETPPTEPVTGSMDGAFFGPHAEQVGGVFSLNRTGGAMLIQDAFVGSR